MNRRERWSWGLNTVGGAAMLVGAIDPLEGSLLILPGSGCMALGTWLGSGARRYARFRLLVFILIALGVGALWSMSFFGGVGGTSGHSVWWSLLTVPYFVGWPMGILGRDSPRWLTYAGMVVGAWYVAMPLMMLARAAQHRPPTLVPVMLVGALGLVTIAGGIARLRPARAPTAPTPGEEEMAGDK